MLHEIVSLVSGKDFCFTAKIPRKVIKNYDCGDVINDPPVASQSSGGSIFYPVSVRSSMITRIDHEQITDFLREINNKAGCFNKSGQPVAFKL